MNEDTLREMMLKDAEKVNARANFGSANFNYGSGLSGGGSGPRRISRVIYSQLNGSPKTSREIAAAIGEDVSKVCNLIGGMGRRGIAQNVSANPKGKAKWVRGPRYEEEAERYALCEGVRI